MNIWDFITYNNRKRYFLSFAGGVLYS
jgi:hypothetical protein